ncbi:MAG: cyclodeaminase [Pseudomonadota bacterium]
MSTVEIFTETDLRRAVALDLEAAACVESAFRALARGDAVLPPILAMDIPPRSAGAAGGEVDVKTAYLPAFPSFAIKVAPGFFDNPKRGLPSTSGLMMLFSAETGLLEALLLDNGYLTDVRTAAAGAVAAKTLSRPEARRAAILGAGAQARLQLEALSLVRPIESAAVWARDPAKAEAMAREMGARLGVAVTAVADRRDALLGADVIVTTTPSETPLIEAAWLAPGQHVTAMGSDQPGKAELAPACLSRADLYVPDSQAQTAVLGELRAALEAGVVAADRVFAELGRIIAGDAPGRAAPEDLTICDLTGTGAQDTAIANLARDRARSLSLGAAIDSAAAGAG